MSFFKFNKTLIKLNALFFNMADTFKKINVDKAFTICPTCNYDKGFHSVFVKSVTEEDKLKWKLICPKCGAKFDIGLVAATQ